MLPKIVSISSALDSREQCDAALYRLLVATIKHEASVALRDREILAIQKQHAPHIFSASLRIVELEGQIQTYYLGHRAEIETDGKKSVQLSNGLIGVRSPTNPALIPLSEKWTWSKIEAKIREVWAKKYFHKPQAPGIDKVKLKRDLTPEQLQECGLQLDTTEQFYLELNRLVIADQLQAAA